MSNFGPAIFCDYVDASLTSGAPVGALIKIQLAENLPGDEIAELGVFAVGLEVAQSLVDSLTFQIKEAQAMAADFSEMCDRAA